MYFFHLKRLIVSKVIENILSLEELDECNDKLEQNLSRIMTSLFVTFSCAAKT